MTAFIARCAALVLALAGSIALALPGTFAIDQAFSNVDGSVQFVVIRDGGAHDCDAGENRWAGQTLVAVGPAPLRTYVFPTDLASCHTSGKRMLIATQGFAALGLVAPDYVMPDGFLQRPWGTLVFAGIASLTYAALPDDGIHAVDALGNVVANLATNAITSSCSDRRRARWTRPSR